MTETISISCDDCVMQATTACDDCLVTFICGRQAGEEVVIAADEERAVLLLVGSGLVPGLRHARRRGSRCP